MWTVERVKSELPKITVKDCNVIYDARILGRQNRFAVICWGNNYQYSFEASWITVVNCLNNNKPVIVS